MNEYRQINKYEWEPVKIKKNSLQYACDLRDKIQAWELTQEQANKILNNPLILI